jgi:hypothetical protein
MARTRAPKFTLEIQAPANGRLKKSTVVAHGKDGKVLFTDTADLASATEREKAAARLATKLKVKPAVVGQQLETAWNDIAEQYQRIRELAAAGSPEGSTAVMRTELLDYQPEIMRRPLTLVGGRAYAAAWCQVQNTTVRSVNQQTGQVTEHNPPLVKIEDRLVVVTEDGHLFSNGGGVPGARPISELGLPVSLPATIPPGRGWSGAGVKSYVKGERPAPAEVFARLVTVVDRFIDFERSLATQTTMCELVACAILATYFLDAINVASYLWPNGESGSGKTTLLQVVTETGYLGQLILAGSSYPTLRDMADYGATLGFDDAEAVMDTKRTDPDKRTLLLAGNRRGATITVKELKGDTWVTRHVNTFSFRLFSAIRLPDQVLGSRSVVVPLVKSGDEKRTKVNVMDEACWPCDRRRLVDDLWAVGLANLSAFKPCDAKAADLARLSGRNLEPWRAFLAVAYWLEEQHGASGVFDRLEKLSVDYQRERSDYEEHDPTRILFRALLEIVAVEHDLDKEVPVRPGLIAERMNAIAKTEELTAPDKDFTSHRKVGWMFRRQRFKRSSNRDERGKSWVVTRRQVEVGARGYGIDPAAAERANDGTTADPEPPVL